MFFRKKIQEIEYDRERYQPVIHQSICTGEQAAGLKDRQTGKFQEIMLIRSEKDLEVFQKMYGVRDIPKEY